MLGLSSSMAIAGYYAAPVHTPLSYWYSSTLHAAAVDITAINTYLACHDQATRLLYNQSIKSSL